MFPRFNRQALWIVPEWKNPDVPSEGFEFGHEWHEWDEGDFYFIKHRELTLPGGFEYEEGGDTRQRDEEDPGVFLRQPGDGRLIMGLHPFANEIGGADAAEPLPPIGVPLSFGLGLHDNTPVVTVDAYNAATGVADLGAAWGATKEGHLAVVYREISDVWTPMSLVRIIDTGTGPPNTATLFPKYPDDPRRPAIGDKLVGGYGFGLAPVAATKSLPSMAMIKHGEHVSDVWRLRGVCIDDIKINAGFREKATIEFGLKIAEPRPPDGDTVHTGLTPQEYGDPPYPEAGQVINGGLYIVDPEENLVKVCGGFEIDVQNETQDVGGIHAADPNGVCGYVQTNRTVRFTINPAFTSANYWQALRDGADQGISIMAWFGIGGAVYGFMIPNALQVSVPESVDQDGKLHETVVFGAGATNIDDDSTSDFANLPFVMLMVASPAPE